MVLWYSYFLLVKYNCYMNCTHTGGYQKPLTNNYFHCHEVKTLEW